MTRKLCGLTAICAVSLAMAVQAQTSSSGSSGERSGSYNSSGSSSTVGGQYNGEKKSEMGWNRDLSPTGRMSHQDIKASQLTGASVTGSTGETLGTISDCIVNPSSGRLEFAIISLNSSGSSSSSTSSSATTSSSLNANGKQVAVPWMLLRSSNNNQAGSTTSSTLSQQSFTFSGDASKLNSAPTFDANTDLSQPNWRHEVFSYFGVGAGQSTGGGESPYGRSSGTFQKNDQERQ